MTETPAREYRMNIDPKILKLLGPNLYTNIYYVLAELIANAYDADAKNVYIISKPDRIIVEDDGRGMSYSQGDVAKYLNVAAETRSNKKDSYTSLGRRKIGRKGVGKLAALSVSRDILVKTIRDSEKSGFILSVNVNKDNILTPLKEEAIVFDVIKASGTSIVMQNPHYELNKTSVAIKKNLLKIFPLVNKDFRIHILQEGQEPLVIDSFDKEMVSQLGGLTIIGERFRHLADIFDNDFPEHKDKLLRILDQNTQEIEMQNNSGEKKKYPLTISGWVGVYKSTAGRKSAIDDFPDNFISVFSNSKLGEYNILPIIGQNRLPEVYVVGQFHVDLFEETELPDMALSNRQGYKTDDPRYKQFLVSAKKYLVDAVELRTIYAAYKKDAKEKAALERQVQQERELREKVDAFRNGAAASATKKIMETGNAPGSAERISNIIKTEIGEFSPILGIKRIVDAQKKRLLISHTGADKDLADIVYKMLLFNNVPAEDIIYTSCDDETSRIPEGFSIFDYLKSFFVESYSTQKIYVVYVTSQAMAKAWGAVTEVGAGWITRVDHKVFNIDGHTPAQPLDTDKEWQTSARTQDGIVIKSVEADKFCSKIEHVCDILKYPKKTRAQNRSQLEVYAEVFSA